MWNSLTWDKVGQVSVIIVVIGITVALVFGGMGELSHALIGTPTAWSTIGGMVAGSGTGAIAYGTAIESPISRATDTPAGASQPEPDRSTSGDGDGEGREERSKGPPYLDDSPVVGLTIRAAPE
jgi:hypothetical protein